MIGNAHIDPVCLWRWPEGCAEAIGTCWAAIDRLEENQGFIFTRGEAMIYHWIERFEPALFARIRDFVHQGHWVIVNGWWVQPDCNLPNGESFIRQALFSKAYFREKFNVDVTVGYNVDSFGHTVTLPMLLRHTGFDSYVFMRPGPHEKVLPASLFDWVAPDGSHVMTFRIPFGYNSSGKAFSDHIKAVDALAHKEDYPFMCFYGVGNHGGGPTRENLAAIHAAQENGIALDFSDPRRYFAAVASFERPEVCQELQFHAIGCYSAVSALKSLNRRAEARLAHAEAASAMALYRANAPYPYTQLQGLWQKLLFNQFHDILGGTSLKIATQDAIETLGGVIQDADELQNTALRLLAATVAPGPEATDATFLVFNLTGIEQQCPVEYEPWLSFQRDERRLLDDSNNEVPYQELPVENAARNSGMRRILFIPHVPSFGYRMYRFTSGKPLPVSSLLNATSSVIESRSWRLEVDSTTGGIARLVDKRAGRHVFSGIAHCPILVEDPSDTWSHGIDRFGYEGTHAVCEQRVVMEEGPLRTGIQVRMHLGASIITNTYFVYDDPRQPFEIRVQVDWREQNKLLRLCYPLSLEMPTFRYEIPAGSLERPADGREYPGQRWVLVSGADGYNFALANDAKYSYAAQEDTLYITALRSPVFAHHDPYVLDPEQTYLYTDQGVQEFTLRLFCGDDVDTRAAYQLADNLLLPPCVTPHVSRRGTEPQCASLLAVETHSSQVTWLKAAEDQHGLVLRLLEVNGTGDTVNVMPGNQEFQLPPYGIATLRTDEQGCWRESDGLES